MNKESILDKFEKNNEKGDEGQIFQDRKADLVTVIVIMILNAVALFVTKNVETFALIVGVVFSGYGCGDMYRFFKIGKNRYLLTGVVFLVAGVLFYVTFLANAKGWA